MTISSYMSPLLQLREPARVDVRFRVLRDGVATAGSKLVRLARSADDIERTFLALVPADAEYTRWVSLPVQLLTDNPVFLLFVEDRSPPVKVFAELLAIDAAGTYTINITSGSGGEATDPAQINASVRVDRLPASREIVVIERPASGEWRVAGRGQTGGDGQARIELGVTGGRVFTVALDDYGTVFTGGIVVPAGQRVRPSVYSGWLYEITEPGTLPAIEPQWWAAEGDNAPRLLGTARAIAVRYYQPLAHGPLPVELL